MVVSRLRATGRKASLQLHVHRLGQAPDAGAMARMMEFPVFGPCAMRFIFFVDSAHRTGRERRRLESQIPLGASWDVAV